MAKFVPDIKTSRWVIIAPSRIMRPHDNPPSPREGGATVGQGTMPVSSGCPFCPGREKENLELFRIGEGSSWKIWVIANKFPITDLHEVIIHSPDHDKDIDELPTQQVELILKTYRARYNYHMQSGHGQVMIFNNHDLHAGASITHPHSQLVVVPRQINLDAIPKEPIQNVVWETDFFTVYCPDFSQWPYEIWIAPREDKPMADSLPEAVMDSRQPIGKNFGQISDSQIGDLAKILQQVLRVMIKKFSSTGALKQNMERGSETGEIPYNYYIYHGPDWYLRVVPRLIHRAGFELGTGLSVNIVDPVQAAAEYREQLFGKDS